MRILKTIIFIWIMMHCTLILCSQIIELPAETLNDKIRGGLLGQILGNINGLPHEMKYTVEPGNVEEYTPVLPVGVQTDDDTDLEWMYIYFMLEENNIFLTPLRITNLWKEMINCCVTSSNRYARQLIDLGIQPPYTGMVVFNPWAEFNISGQYICETFGLISPCMPQTAARIGLNYTRVTIDAEPAQTTQLFTTMIATAFTEDNIKKIIEVGMKALDSTSITLQIIKDELKWYEQYPKDWRTTRKLTKEKYSRFGSRAPRDYNGYELNTASIIASLLYGGGDFVKTLKTVFNFGWDADCNAATAGTIIGVMKGYRWILSQGWEIVDRYNSTRLRKNMPKDETITSFADRLIHLAEKVITNQGGERIIKNGKPFYKIKTEKPGNIYQLQNLNRQISDLQEKMKNNIAKIIIEPKSSNEEKARAAYYAICLKLAKSLKQKHPTEWNKAINALNSYWNVAQVLFYYSDVPQAKILQEEAIAVGFKKPDNKKKIWE